MTLGVIRNAELPKAILERKFKWQQDLAEDWLAVNYLSKSACVELDDNKIDHWKLVINGKMFVCKMTVVFMKKQRKITALNVIEDETNMLTEYLLKSIFDKSKSIFAFVSSIDIILYGLANKHEGI